MITMTEEQAFKQTKSQLERDILRLLFDYSSPFICNRQRLEIAQKVAKRFDIKPKAALADASFAFLLLDRIISELPSKRDWLDPQLEREARELVGR